MFVRKTEFQIEEVATLIAIFKDNRELCENVSNELIVHIVNLIEHQARNAVFLEFLQCIVVVHDEEIEGSQEKTAQEVSLKSKLIRFSYLFHTKHLSSVTLEEVK